MISVGADVAQDKIDICVYDCHSRKVLLEQTISNDPQGFRSLEIVLKPFKPGRILVENTGGLEESFCFHFRHKIPELLVLNPKQVKRFKEACFEDQKTDRIDAKALAHMAILHDLKGSKEMNVEEKQLQSLLRQRNYLVKERTAFFLRKQRLKRQVVHFFVTQQNAKMTTFFDKEIAKLETKLLRMIAKNAHTQEQFKNLQTIPGIGEKTAFELIHHLGGNAGRFVSAEKFCAYAGLYPTKRESGQMRGKERLTSKGCRPLRSALYLTALSNIGGHHKDTTMWRKYYDLKLSQGKKPKQILMAMANKLARLAWFISARNWQFDASKFAPSFA